MSEPYEELDPETQDRVVQALRQWALAHESPDRPFLELLSGDDITPRDLLTEAPPREGFAYPRERPLALQILEALRHRLWPGEPRAWKHVLNLVAFSALHGEDGIEQILDAIARHADAGGMASA